jgi:5-methylcytosine-specific restriction enzyme B
MNTVDKSIALVDFALRRRFAFVTLRSVEDGKSVVLRSWLDENQIANSEEVELLFVTLNKVIAAKSEDLMIGHSYFMSAEIVEEKRVANKMLKFIWRYYILPLMAEYEYELNSKQVEEKYGLEAIKSLATKA